MIPADIHEAAEGARLAMRQAEDAMTALLSCEISQADGAVRLERAFADLSEYTGLVVTYAGTLTTPPPYYPGDLAADLAAARELDGPSRLTAFHG
jgi:hypothetical protein